jgi:hypothetical protein
MRLWHGTDVDSAAALLSGSDLDARRATAARLDVRTLVGFYLAELEDEGAHFAAVRGGALLVIDVEDPALAALLDAGARWQEVRKGPWPPLFVGRELYLPPAAFPVFNRLRREGLIRVTPS